MAWLVAMSISHVTTLFRRTKVGVHQLHAGRLGPAVGLRRLAPARSAGGGP